MNAIRNVLAALVLLALPPVAAPAAAQDSSTGVLLVAHGAGPEWNVHVEAIARLVNTGGPLEVTYLMGPAASAHPFQAAAQRLVERGARQIVVVPMLISSYSGHYEQIRYLVGETDELEEIMMHHLHMAGLERPRVQVPIRITPAIDAAPEVAQVLAERARALAVSPADQALFLVAHGPNSAEDNAQWLRNLRLLAEQVNAATGFRNVMVGTVRDDAPALVRAEAVEQIRAIIGLQHMATGRPVVVVPVLISTGRLSHERLPRDLAGLQIAYTGEPLLPHPALARWVEARVREGGRLVAPAAAPARPAVPHHGRPGHR
jgi:sirohydrochlorin ferrochelatase